MASATTGRLTEVGVPVPNRGTYPIAANTLIVKGSIVGLNSSGQAIQIDDDGQIPGGSTLPSVIVGVAEATYDNRTGSEAGGSAGDLDVEVAFGIAGPFNIEGSTPLPGTLVYAADNQSIDATVTNGVSAYALAGVYMFTRNSKAYIYMGPHVVALAGAIAAANAYSDANDST